MEPGGSPEHQHARAESKARLLGLWIFLGGLAFSAFTVGWPIWQAKNHESEIWLSMKGVAVSLLLTLFGIWKMISGSTADKINKLDEKNLKFRDVATILVLAALGIAGYLWLRFHLEGLGYTF
jgi:hypothetical protein